MKSTPILIDEARTPHYQRSCRRRHRQVYAEEGEYVCAGTCQNGTSRSTKRTVWFSSLKRHFPIEAIMGVTNLYGEHAEWVHFIDNALKANNLFKRDTDYIVRNSEIIIVDENTGRLMEGRRYSEGIHQAIEAKEGVDPAAKIRRLTITFKNYFRMYKSSRA